MPALKSDRLWADIPRVPMFDDVDLNEHEDMSNPNERPRSMLVSCFAPCFRGAHRLTQLLLCDHASPKTYHRNVPYAPGFANATVQLWDKKTKRDDDLSDSEDGGEGGQRFEKDRSMKASSKKPSGEVSMDISKAPSPAAGGTGADIVATTLDTSGLGLRLDTPEASKTGTIGDTAPPLPGGMETVDTGLGALGNTGLDDSRYNDVMGNVTERDVDMVG